jgi:hypothetical protein
VLKHNTVKGYDKRMRIVEKWVPLL